ncbi:uncharacterized protein DNG_00098 [Cephalotrichum gorgonifer]|uniref:Increased loss of mitochondrial DNA protein 1 n=1 Tax=Cephalotrichum gorgonifer TaxID=2041049 RepID=A0AAE8MPP7_9PEZI|nr:uncharacterized protein DNG_00098 [Cephalotrichum gorgonifer]
MALISARTIITSVSLFHLTLAFFFLTNPGTIADQAIVYVIGEAMGMPYARSFENHSPPLALLAIILATMGISDLASLSLPEEVCLFQHWTTQAPIRLTVSLGLTIYAFLASSSSPLYSARQRSTLSHPSAHAFNPSYRPSTWGGEALKNRVIFAFVFFETFGWFWAWVTLREERSIYEAKKARRRNHMD